MALLSTKCCEHCEKKICAENCPPGALVKYGYTMTLNELMQEIEKDSVFYRQSSGGVTASGGEPLLQATFVAELFARCHVKGYHTAIETSSEVAFEQFIKVIPHTNLFLCDLKPVDTHTFKKYTGGNVSIILENLIRLSEYNAEVILRTLLIPGFNADKDSIAAICDFARSLGHKIIHFLPYHRLGMQKYISLSKDYPFEVAKVMEISDVEELLRITTKFGIQAKIGSDI
jgi:pyruvate formate lyase activating enzyme